MHEDTRNGGGRSRATQTSSALGCAAASLTCTRSRRRRTWAPGSTGVTHRQRPTRPGPMSFGGAGALASVLAYHLCWIYTWAWAAGLARGWRAPCLCCTKDVGVDQKILPQHEGLVPKHEVHACHDVRCRGDRGAEETAAHSELACGHRQSRSLRALAHAGLDRWCQRDDGRPVGPSVLL